MTLFIHVQMFYSVQMLHVYVYYVNMGDMFDARIEMLLYFIVHLFQSFLNNLHYY